MKKTGALTVGKERERGIEEEASKGATGSLEERGEEVLSEREVEEGVEEVGEEEEVDPEETLMRLFVFIGEREMMSRENEREERGEPCRCLEMVVGTHICCCEERDGEGE